jgi:DHA1 family tetracycline resistance protein-like MFS transporter
MASATRKASTGLVFIFVTLLLDVMGIGLILPILPQLVTSLTADPTAGARYYGALFTIFTLMQFICAPGLGALSDQWGRKPILILSMVGSGIGYLMMALAPTLGWLFAARALAGIAGASVTAASAYIADVSTPETRAQNFGLLGAAFGLGFIFGPALGGLLGNIDMRLPFFAAAAVSLLNAAYGLLVVPESHRLENRRRFTLSKANPFSWIGLLKRYPVVMGMAFTLLLTSLAHNSLHSVWVLFTAYRFHWNPGQNGLALAFVGVASAVVQGGLIRVIVPKLGERQSVLWGIGISAVAFTLYGLATQGWMMYAVIAFGSLGGIAGPALQGMIASQISPDEQGAVQGALASLMSATGIVAPLMASGLFAHFTAPSAAPTIPGIAFFVGAALLVLSLVNTLWQFRRHASPAPAPSPVSPV